MDQSKKKLATVTYSRSYQAERDLPAVLVGSSRWLRDIELLMEDEWPGLSHTEIQPSIATSSFVSGVGLAIVEGTADVDGVRQCIESMIPAQVNKVIVIPESINPFVRKNYLNYGAKNDVRIMELSDDAKSASKELSEVLGSLLGRVHGEIEKDIERAELLIDGFASHQPDVVSLQFMGWEARSEAVVSWLFPLVTLTTSEYRLLRVLARARPLFEVKGNWVPSVSETLLPLQSFANSTRTKDYLELILALAEKMPANSAPSLEQVTAVVSASSVGLLMKRALTKNLSSLALRTFVPVRKSA